MAKVGLMRARGWLALAALLLIAAGAKMSPSACASDDLRERERAGKSQTPEPLAVSPDGRRSDPPDLKGQVRGTALLTEDGLKKIGAAAGDLQKSTLLLMGEVTRKDTVPVKPPNVIGPNVVIPPMPIPSGSIEFGDLPPREGIVRRLVSDTDYQVQLLQNSVDAIILPEHKYDRISPEWARLRQTMEGVQEHLARLKTLAERPPFDKVEIGREALAIHDAMDTVKKLKDSVEEQLRSD